MKEFFVRLIQNLGTMFLQQYQQQPEAEEERANRNTEKLLKYLLSRFDFRHNQLTGVTEYRSKEDTCTAFRPVDERNLNGMIVDARLKGIACWNSMVPTLVLSDKVEDYHPFHLYMSELPDWDGTDRVTPLLDRVSDDALLMKGGR